MESATTLLVLLTGSSRFYYTFKRTNQYLIGLSPAFTIRLLAYFADNQTPYLVIMGFHTETPFYL
jgi:hypothetical protein